MKSTAQFIVYGSGYLRACMIFFFHRKYQSLAGEAFKQYARTRIKDGSGPEFSSVFGHQNWKKGLQNNKTRVRIVFAAGRKYANRTPFPAVLHVGRFTASQISPALAWIVFPASCYLSLVYWYSILDHFPANVARFKSLRAFSASPVTTEEYHIFIPLHAYSTLDGIFPGLQTRL